MSTASRGARQRAAIRWRPKPVTLVILGVTTVVTVALMLLPILGIWPPKTTEPITVKAASPYAAGLKLEIVGTPEALTVQTSHNVTSQGTVTTVTDSYQVVTVTVKLTNNVMQPPPIQGTQTAGAPTPAPEPAKLLGAGIKVLFYDAAASDANKQIVGSGIGTYYNANGLAPGESDTIQVVATDVGKFNDKGYEAFADGLWTDKDPVKTPEPLSDRLWPSSQALLPARNLTP